MNVSQKRVFEKAVNSQPGDLKCGRFVSWYVWDRECTKSQTYLSRSFYYVDRMPNIPRMLWRGTSTWDGTV